MAATVPPQRYVVNPRAQRGRYDIPPRPKHVAANTLAIIFTFLLIGMLLGASIGWVLFPIEAQQLINDFTETKNAAPSRERVIAVADKYWRSLDAVDAQSQLSSYNADDLAAVIAAILQETKSGETRTEVAALAQALDLYPANPSLLDVLGSPVILALLLALVPIALAIWLVLLPALRERRTEQKRLEQEATAGLNRDGGALPNAAGAEAAQANGAAAENAKADAAEMAPAPAANSAPGEAATLPPLQAAQPQETEEEAAEHAAEESEILNDLANLFEEEDTSLSALEAMVKNLAEINIGELGAKVRDIANQFRNHAWVNERT